MRWSLGTTALLLAMTAGGMSWAAEPVSPGWRPGSRPAHWPIGQGFLASNHVRATSTDVVGGDVAPDAVIAPGGAPNCNCEDQPPCINHLWDGYVQRPRRCNPGHHHGMRNCAPCGDACDSCGLGGNRLGRAKANCGACDECGGHAAFCRRCGGCGLGKGPLIGGGLGKFWASCFGDDGASDCGCPTPAGEPVAVPGAAVIPGPRIEPDLRDTLPGDEAPMPPKPPVDDASARRIFPTLRGFGSGLK